MTAEDEAIFAALDSIELQIVPLRQPVTIIPNCDVTSLEKCRQVICSHKPSNRLATAPDIVIRIERGCARPRPQPAAVTQRARSAIIQIWHDNSKFGPVSVVAARCCWLRDDCVWKAR